jgi:hypothetical protein
MVSYSAASVIQNRSCYSRHGLKFSSVEIHSSKLIKGLNVRQLVTAAFEADFQSTLSELLKLSLASILPG